MSPTPSPREAARGERRCIVSGERYPEADLIRFAVAPDGAVTPDVAAKLPGRGAWVRADRASVQLAADKGLFSRAFKRTTKPAPDLADRTEALLARRCLAGLGLMRRAGALVLGAEQVEAAIRDRPPYIVIEATDGAEGGREALMSLFLARWERPPRAVGCFSASELGVALGRQRVIHACVLQERLAAAWAVDIGRLAGFRAIVPSSWPDSWRLVGWGLGGADAGPLRAGERGGQQGV